MTDPVADLRKIRGWVGFHEHDYTIFGLIHPREPTTIVETGLGRGDSTHLFLTLLSMLPNPEQRSLVTYEIRMDEIYDRPKLDTVLDIQRRHYPAKWTLLQQDSRTAVYDRGAPIDVLFLDADHDVGSVRAELRAFEAHLAPRAIVLADDAAGQVAPQGPDVAMSEWAPRHGFQYKLVLGSKGLAVAFRE